MVHVLPLDALSSAMCGTIFWTNVVVTDYREITSTAEVSHMFGGSYRPISEQKAHAAVSTERVREARDCICGIGE
jgi:hypothetical protein